MKDTKVAELREEIVAALAEAGYDKPTPIQDKSFNQLLTTERHLVALAPEGSGKTGAYGLPILRRIDRSLPMLQAIILVPRSEDADELARELRQYAIGRLLARILVLPDDGDLETQSDELQEQVHIAVTTPRRAAQLLEYGGMALSQVVWLVLDDADQIMESGMRKQVETVMRYVSQHRRIVLSAESMPRSLDDFARKRLRKYDKINMAKPVRKKKPERSNPGPKNEATDRGGQRNEKEKKEQPVNKREPRNKKPEPQPKKDNGPSMKADESAPRPRRKLRGNGETPINYSFYKVPARGRFRYLLQILKETGEQRRMIFVKNSRKMRDLLRFLIQEEFSVAGMAEKMPSHQYDKVLRRFQEKEASIMIATDGIVADLDFEGVTQVVHYNPPEDEQGYLERHDFLEGAKDAQAILLGHKEEEQQLPELASFFKAEIEEKTVKLPPKAPKPEAQKKDSPKQAEEQKPLAKAKEEQSRKRDDRGGKGREKGKPEARGDSRDRNPRKDSQERSPRKDSRNEDRNRERRKDSRKKDPRNEDRSRDKRRSPRDEDRSRGRQESRDHGALPRRMERVYESEYVDTPDTPRSPRKLTSQDLAEVIEAVRTINPAEAGLDRQWAAIYKKLEKLTWEEVIRHFVAYIVQTDVVQDLDEEESEEEGVSGIKALFRAFSKRS
jgi:superfamily II DNA/RNA helicase